MLLTAASGTAPLQAQIVYDATAEFSITNGNPNGAWSYGWMPTNFSAFHAYTTAYSNAAPKSWGWTGPSGYLWKNLDNPAYGVPTGWLALRPGSGNEPSILRWTSPSSGVAHIRGRFLPGDIGSLQVAVRNGAATLWQASDSGEFDLVAGIMPDDVLDFVAYGTFAWADTPIETVIALHSGSLLFMGQRDYSIQETNATLAVEVRRVGRDYQSTSVTVDYTTVDDTALAGLDYGTTSGTLHFAAGETNKFVLIPILNDALKEGEELFRLVLSNPAGGVSLGNSNAVIRIQDNDWGVGFVSTNLTVAENVGTVSVTVRRGDDLNQAFTVDYATADDSAVAGADYVTTAGTLQFAAGETNKTITIPILNDALKEGEEQFRLVLSNPTGGVSIGNATASAWVRIQDNDPGVRLASTNLLVAENAGSVSVTVLRGDGLNPPCTVDYATVAGTATAGLDYAATNGTLQFAAGEVSKLIIIPILNDALAESEEQFGLMLSNPTGGVSLANSNALIRIQDNDWGVGFAHTNLLVMENAGLVSVTVLRGDDLNQAFSVDYATAADTAVAGVDYVATNGTLQFAAGETSKTIGVLVLDDALSACEPHFFLVLSNPTGGTSLGASNLLIRIQHDDPATRYVNIANPRPSFPYCSWATAATNIQDAVDAAIAGDTVLATNGVYAVGNRFGNRVMITNAIRLESVNGPAVTVIDGGGSVRCVSLSDDAVLNGFTITNGWARWGGGGVQAEPNAVITNCVVIGNLASPPSAYSWAMGGGVRGGIVYDSILANNFSGFDGDGAGGGADGSILYNCVLTNNTVGGEGGGAFRCTLYNCVLTDNTARGLGGGVSRCNLYNCKLINNSVEGYGGGANWSTLVNCILTGNVAVSDEFGDYGGYGGGAIASELYNCTVVDNLAWVAGGGVAESTLANCIVAYNAAWFDPNYYHSEWGGVLNFSCTTPMPTSGIGNITNAPRFVDFANGNLRLQSYSPCINAGNNSSTTFRHYSWQHDDYFWFTNRFDMDGLPRIVSGTVDIGAYEFQGSGSRLSYAWLQNYGLPTDGSADFADADLDGRNTWQEWRCLTDPTNALSVLRLLSASPLGTNVIVRWPSAAGVNYFLERSTNVTGPLPIFTPLATNLVGQAGLTTFTDTNAARLAPLFYRVGVGN